MNQQRYQSVKDALKGTVSEIDRARSGPFPVQHGSRVSTTASLDAEGVVWNKLLNLSVAEKFDTAVADSLIGCLIDLARADGYLVQCDYFELESVEKDDETTDAYDTEMYLHRVQGQIDNLDTLPSHFISPNEFLTNSISSFGTIEARMSDGARTYFTNQMPSLPLMLDFDMLAKGKGSTSLSWRCPLIDVLVSAYHEGVAEAKKDHDADLHSSCVSNSSSFNPL